MTETIWYTRDHTTIRYLTAIAARLERIGAALLDDVRIVVVGEEAVNLPDGRTVTERTLPPEGLLVAGRSVF